MIVLCGNRVEIPGVRSVSFLDDPSLCPAVTDHSPRTRRVRAVVLHTHSGTATGVVKPGRLNEDDKLALLARYQARTDRQVSWDFTVGRDARVFAQNDPADRYTWHATSWNAISMGIELIQDGDGALYAEQIDAAVRLIDLLTRTFRIQRQIAWRGGQPHLAMIERANEKGSSKGADMVGVFAHVHNTTSRGKGDPGPAIFKALASSGYDLFDYTTGNDLSAWKARQQQLGIKADGIPLDATCDALAKQAGQSSCGLWVTRPGD
jgi:hypothetical protein